MQQSLNQPLTIMIAAPSDEPQDYYPSRQALRLSSVQILLASVCFVSQVVALHHGGSNSYLGTGIWGGILIAVAGGLGIGAAKKKSTCMIMAFMVMSIIAASATFSIILDASFGLRGRHFYWSKMLQDLRYCNSDGPGWTGGDGPRKPQCTVNIAMYSIQVISGVAELVIAVWASVICCCAIYRRSEQTSTGVRFQGDPVPRQINPLLQSAVPREVYTYTHAAGVQYIADNSGGNIQYATPVQTMTVPQATGASGSLPTYHQATSESGRNTVL